MGFRIPFRQTPCFEVNGMPIRQNVRKLSAEERMEYTTERIQSGLNQIRLTFFVSAILYALFAFLDHLLIGEYLPAFLVIRFAIVIPLLIVFIAWTYHASFINVAQPLIVLCYVAAGTGIAFMLIVVPDNFSYYGGFFMVISLGYFLSKLDTRHAVFGGALSMILYLAGYAAYYGTLRLEAWLVLTFFAGANLIGAIGNSQLERIGQANFLQKREIRMQNELLKNRVREQRTELLQIEKAIASTSDAVVIFNPTGEITYRNMAYDELMQPLISVGRDASHPFEEIIVLALAEGAWKGERRVTGLTGVSRVLSVQANAVQDDGGQNAGVVVTCRDITERKDVEEKMRYLSFHDQLTGLFNRTWFDEELHRLDKARQLPLSLIMADLNGLKLINDTYGHVVGDRFLQHSADILRQACRGEDIIARWGGDEFVVLLPKNTYDEARKIADRIVTASQEVLFEGIPFSVALGVASKEVPDEPITVALQAAEDRMYKQKLTESRSHKSAVLNALRNTLQEKSCETDTHAGNMQEAAHYIAEQIGLSRDERSRLDLVIRLHDIGKINMPGELLRKNSALTSEEWEVMRQHPEIGYRIARATDEVAHVAEEILSHHERWDGSGYPRGLKGKEISLLARITALVDAYEVMQNGRPYKSALSVAEIREELVRCAGKHFDPELVEVFLSCPLLHVNANRAAGAGEMSERTQERQGD